jgi:hypothetical protein
MFIPRLLLSTITESEPFQKRLHLMIILMGMQVANAGGMLSEAIVTMAGYRPVSGNQMTSK